METIKEGNIVDLYTKDMVTYLIIANRRRAIPECRDSFKPVQRRVLYDMSEELNATSFKKKVKSARIVGDVMGKYHAHGDSSIYDCMVPLTNWYSAKVQLIMGEGNWGTIAGDPPAAMRYTEAYLSDFTNEFIMSALKETKNVINWNPNFDETRLEPEYLPLMVPLLLINGTMGIGVGMRADIPTHNLGEVIDATINLMHNPNAPVALVPDLCTRCNIVDTNWKQISNTGSGSFRVRGIIEIGEHNKHQALFIKSIPDSTNTKAVTRKINDLIEAGKLPQVYEVNDASTSNQNNSRKKKKTDNSADGPINIIVELKKGVDPYYVRDVLYKSCNVEMSYNVNFEVINGIEPVRLSYKAYLQIFLDYAMTTKFRLYSNRLQIVKTQWHEIEPFIKISKSGAIDKVINLLRGKNITRDDAIEKLIKMFDITDIQASRIVNTRLIDLTSIYVKQKEAEGEELIKKARVYMQFLEDDNLLLQEIEADLIRCKEKYNTPRISKLVKLKDDSNIPQGNFKIIITENNFVRKIGENENPNVVKGDKPKYIIPVENTESLLVFDNKGKVFKLECYRVPICSRTDAGMDIRTAIKGCTADIAAVYYEPIVRHLSKLKRKHFGVILTEKNYIKKLDLEDFLTVLPSGLLYTKLNSGDMVKEVQIIPDDLDIIVYSKHKALRFSMMEIPHYKRSTMGVSAMNTKEPIGGLNVLYPDATHIVVVTEAGKANKFNIAGLAKSARYKSGSSVIKLSRGDSIIAIYGVNNKNRILLDTSKGQTQVNVSDIKMESSISSGIKLPIDRGDFIIKSTLIK